jgi:hypothetical protein
MSMSKLCTYHSGPNCIISGKKFKYFFQSYFEPMWTVFILCRLYLSYADCILSYADCIYPIQTVFILFGLYLPIYPMRTVFILCGLYFVFILCGLYFLSYADCIYPMRTVSFPT